MVNWLSTNAHTPVLKATCKLTIQCLWCKCFITIGSRSFIPAVPPYQGILLFKFSTKCSSCFVSLLVCVYTRLSAAEARRRPAVLILPLPRRRMKLAPHVQQILLSLNYHVPKRLCVLCHERSQTHNDHDIIRNRLKLKENKHQHVRGKRSTSIQQ